MAENVTVKKGRGFRDLIQLEQLRHIEAEQAQNLTYAGIVDMERHPIPGFHYAAFLAKLSDRARGLIRDNALNDVLQRPENLFLRASRIMLLCATILGALAAINATGESSTLNIYLLLAVLLGFNFLSMLLWCIGIVMGIQGLSAGVAVQIASWLPFHFRKKNQHSISALAVRGWWETCLSGKTGKWRFSLLTHQFWLVYLAAGIVMLVLLMLAKQYDFVWGTTLLPSSSLPEITRLLAIPMEYIGLLAPDGQQIAASQIGNGIQDAQTRSAWAIFLIGVLVVYGLLPRLILAVGSFLMLKLSEYRFRLDLYLPYYVALRQKLVANEFVTRVIDRDPGVPTTSSSSVFTEVSQRHLPADAQVIGIELDESVIWPEGITCSLNVTDRTSYAQVTEEIRKSKQALLIGVAAHRLPDRGVQRMISELAALAAGQVWMMLLYKRDDAQVAAVTESRKSAWFRLAQACAIPAEQVIS